MSPASYRSLIDAMVKLARSCLNADRIRSTGHAERTGEKVDPLGERELAHKVAMQSMSAQQREAVAQMLEDERREAFHDVLANLPAFGIELEGRELSELADEVPHWDFMDRMAGTPWRT